MDKIELEYLMSKPEKDLTKEDRLELEKVYKEERYKAYLELFDLTDRKCKSVWSVDRLAGITQNMTLCLANAW